MANQVGSDASGHFSTVYFMVYKPPGNKSSSKNFGEKGTKCWIDDLEIWRQQLWLLWHSSLPPGGNSMLFHSCFNYTKVHCTHWDASCSWTPQKEFVSLYPSETPPQTIFPCRVAPSKDFVTTSDTGWIEHVALALAESMSPRSVPTVVQHPYCTLPETILNCMGQRFSSKWRQLQGFSLWKGWGVNSMFARTCCC